MDKVDRFKNVLYQIQIFGLPRQLGTWRPIYALPGPEQPRIYGGNREEIIGLARRFTGYQPDNVLSPV